MILWKSFPFVKKVDFLVRGLLFQNIIPITANKCGIRFDFCVGALFGDNGRLHLRRCALIPKPHIVERPFFANPAIIVLTQRRIKLPDMVFFEIGTHAQPIHNFIPNSCAGCGKTKHKNDEQCFADKSCPIFFNDNHNLSKIRAAKINFFYKRIISHIC